MANNISPMNMITITDEPDEVCAATGHAGHAGHPVLVGAVVEEF